MTSDRLAMIDARVHEAYSQHNHRNIVGYDGRERPLTVDNVLADPAVRRVFMGLCGVASPYTDAEEGTVLGSLIRLRKDGRLPRRHEKTSPLFD